MRSVGLALLAATVSGNAMAQQPVAVSESGGKRIFPPEFFSGFHPVTALDMVDRIPGFSIARNEGRRGFGENAGNVLIDGERASTKSDDIVTLLSRIPVGDVERIELIEQAGGDAEAQGKGQIVNIVRKASSRISGTFAANMLLGTHYGITPFGSGSATLRSGDTSYEVNFSSFSERLRGFGPEDFRDGSANLVERRRYLGRGAYDEFSIGGAIKSRQGAIKINANAKYTITNGTDRRLGRYSNAGGVFTGSERLFTNAPQTDSRYEVGGDIAFPLTPHLNSKLIGLYRSGIESSSAFIETERLGQPATLFRTQNRNTPSEAVFRIQNDWSPAKNHTLQFGAELAYNRLDARFSASSANGGITTVFPASNVLVEEVRIEPFLSDVWTLSPQWKIEGGAIAEFSTLKLSGDSQARRRFRFIKPRLVATWTIDKATTVELRAERQVAQLDFEDYATSVDLALGNQVDAGNAELVPEKTNRLAALIRHKFLDRGSIQFEASYVDVSDTQDLVLVTTRDAAGAITGRFDGAGNIGKSKRWNGELEITLPFDWLTQSMGVSGLELKYVGHYHGSRVIDPVTGTKRRAPFRPLWHQDWNLRHTIKDSGIIWGFSWAEREAGFAYFFNQIRREDFGPNASAFVEYNGFSLGTLKIELIGLTGEKLRRNRFFYSDTRASNVLTQIINRERTLDPRIQLTLSGTF